MMKDEKCSEKLKKQWEKGKSPTIYSVRLQQKIGNIPAGNYAKLKIQDNNALLIESSTGIKSKLKVELDYHDITSVYYGLQNSEFAEERSALARGIAGAALAGTAGAVIGSATANSKTGKRIRALRIDYTNSVHETRSLLFDVTQSTGVKQFAQMLRIACDIPDLSETVVKLS